MAISVVIVDDQAMVRLGLGALLAAQRDVRVVGEAADGAQAALFAYQHGVLSPET